MRALTRIALCTLAVAATASVAQAQSGDSGNWIVRGRAVYLDSSNDNSSELKANLTAVVGAPAEASINNRWLPELDITYFFTPNIAAELILTYPQEQDLKVNGAKIGSFKHLPPTLTAQYHFTGMSGFRPYVGAGINYTRLSSVEFDPSLAALDLDLDRNSWGFAVQAGVDVPIGGGWLLNVDVKKVQIDTDVKSAGAKIGNFGVDPWLFGIGVGKRF